MKQFQVTTKRAFMYRLAAKLGIVDVDGLANSLTPIQIREWEAIAISDGWYDTNPTAEIQASLHNLGNRTCIVSSSDPRAMHRGSIWRSGWDYVKDRFGTKKKKNNVSQVQSMLKKRHGN